MRPVDEFTEHADEEVEYVGVALPVVVAVEVSNVPPEE